MKKFLLATSIFLSICTIALAQEKKSAVHSETTSLQPATLSRQEANRKKLMPRDNAARKLQIRNAGKTPITRKKRVSMNQ